MNIPDLLQGPQRRTATIDALNEEQRIVTMRAVPYDVEIPLAPGIFESFAPRAFAAAAKDVSRLGDVKLWKGHSDVGGDAVGKAIGIDDKPDGVWVDARVSRTQAGDELLTLAQDGVLEDASIEFMPLLDPDRDVKHKNGALHVRHRRARLLGVALVAHGAYGREAQVLSVRDARTQEIEAARIRARKHLLDLNG